jgi:fluoroacetyl-CoA thioesterase
MKATLVPGLEVTHSFTVPESKTVPHLFPEAPEFRTMPRVFATGFLVGLVEWTCMLVIAPHLDGPSEQSVGTQVNLSHTAATPPGMTVTVTARLERVEGRRLYFSVSGSDGADAICHGTHERVVVDIERFNAKVALKRPSTS